MLLLQRNWTTCSYQFPLSPGPRGMTSSRGENAFPRVTLVLGQEFWNWETQHQPRWHTEKQRHYFVNKGPSSQGYGFSTSHVWMGELDCEESWVLKNWCFWTVVLEKTWESLGLQGDPTSPFWRRSALGFLLREWC